MDDLDRQALEQLIDLGYTGIKITGREGDRILYTHTNGDSVLDGPLARIEGDQVVLESWMAHLQ
jgi:hypothetical protein